MSPEAALSTCLSALAPEAVQRGIGAAVSGGGDSLALMVLLADWARIRGARLEIASVDHGVRPEAAHEIAQVAALAADLSLRHETLRWSGWDGAGNFQAAARQARYRLLADWAAVRDLPHVCLGHTRDDQAETVLMRLARGSGVDGLAAMAPARREAAVVWLRPLLETSRQDLRAELTRRGLGWAEDPGNDDPGFDRVRARRMLAELAPLGITADRLSETATRMRAARTVLATAAVQAAGALATVEAGDIVLDRQGVFGLPDETRWRLFAGALCRVAGAPYRPRLDALRRTLDTLARGGRATLHGCLCRAAGQTLRIGREPGAVAAPVPAPGVWDGRWRIVCPPDAGLMSGALGEAGLAERPGWRDSGLPRKTLLASPALWQGRQMQAALLLDAPGAFRAEPVWGKAEFMAFLQSD